MKSPSFGISSNGKGSTLVHESGENVTADNITPLINTCIANIRAKISLDTIFAYSSI